MEAVSRERGVIEVQIRYQRVRRSMRIFWLD